MGEGFNIKHRLVFFKPERNLFNRSFFSQKCEIVKMILKKGTLYLWSYLGIGIYKKMLLKSKFDNDNKQKKFPP